MEIFLVRHGQTGGNIAHRHQAAHTPLTARGEQQAREAAKIIQTYKPTHLLTSSLVRAVETAAIIGEECGLIPETSPTFIELARPNHMHGHHHRSPRSVWFYILWYMGSRAALHAEGETYETMVARFSQAKFELSQYPEDARVIVVTHSVFMSFFIEHLCRQKKVSPVALLRVAYRIVTMKNTHIQVLRFRHDAHPDVCAWSVQ